MAKKIVVLPEDTRSKEEQDRDFADSFRRDVNNLSFWYSKVKNCGIDQPKTVIIQTPIEIMKDLFEPHMHLTALHEYVSKNIIPQIPDDMFFLFVKNGTFSNKFNFGESCRCRKDEIELLKSFINVNYMAACCDAGGVSEFIIREFIGNWNYIDEHIPCIYNGMPLRPEFRVFYDFDKKVLLYSVFYWDYDYCHKEIERNVTDKIVYNQVYQDIELEYEKRKSEVEVLVSEHMKSVDLSGKWSIDIMWDEEQQKYWLIDMATAETSAYWNKVKVNEA